MGIIKLSDSRTYQGCEEMNQELVLREKSTRMGVFRSLCVSHVVINFSLTLLMTTATLREFQYIEDSQIREVIKRHIAEVSDASAINMIIHPKVDPKILNIIVSEYTSVRPIFLAQEDGFSRPCNSTSPKLQNIVGIFETLSDVEPTKWKTLYNSIWNPRSKIAIWITKLANPDHVLNILDKFWSVGSLNIILLSIHHHSTDITIHSYNPFWMNEGAIWGRVYTLSAVEKLYPDKMKNLQGYPITISMYDTFKSIWLKKPSQLTISSDVTILNVLSSWLNFTIKLNGRPMSLRKYYKKPLSNGKIPGAIHDLITNYSEVLGNTQRLEVVSDSVEYCEPYSQGQSRIVVPGPTMIPKIIRIFQSWNISAVILLTLLSIIPVICMHIRGIPGSILNTFRLIIHHQYYGVGSRLSERIFAISWILFSFLFLLLQQSHLIDDMTNRLAYTPMDTFEELADSNLPVMANPYQFSALNLSDNASKRKIAERTEIEVDYTVCLGRLWAGEHIACFIITATVSTTLPALRVPNRDDFEIHEMRDVLSNYWRTMLVRKDFPYLPKFNVGFRKLMENGLIADLIEKERHAWKLRDPPYNKLKTPLNLSHFEGPFKILLYGVVIATGAFISEIIIYRVQSACRSLCDEILYGTQLIGYHCNDTE